MLSTLPPPREFQLDEAPTTPFTSKAKPVANTKPKVPPPLPARALPKRPPVPGTTVPAPPSEQILSMATPPRSLDMPSHVAQAKPLFVDVGFARPAMAPLPAPPPHPAMDDAVRVNRDRIDRTILSASGLERRSKRRWKLRAGLVLLAVVAEVAFAHRASLRGPLNAKFAKQQTAPAAPAVAPAAAPPPSASASASASASPETMPSDEPQATTAPEIGNPAIPADKGLLKTSAAPAHRRIFVEDRVVGQTPDAVLVSCGKFRVRIGSAGQAAVVDIPCGSEISVGATK